MFPSFPESSLSYRGEACIIILQDVGMKFREKKIFFLSAKTPKNKTKPKNTKKTKQQTHTASFEGMLKKKMEIRYEFDIKKT